MMELNIWQNLFDDENKALEFLAELKWCNGFVCRKCGHTNSCLGKVPHSRRCTRCKNEESATSATSMHNIKFSANKAFYILSQIYSNETKISIVELTKKLELSQLTVLKFVSKMENRIARMKLLNDGQMPDPNDFLGSNDIVVGKE